MKRRDFLKSTAVASLTSAVPFLGLSSCYSNCDQMQLSFTHHHLQLKYKFGISSNVRTSSPITIVKIRYGDFIGIGEASMPPYLGESHHTVEKFLKQIDLSPFKNPFELETILNYIHSLSKYDSAAKAAVDIALHDLIGKMLKQPLYNIWGYNKERTPTISFTIGIDSLEMIRKKTQEAKDFKILKIKLGAENDKEIIRTVREISSKPICVDVNQGWKTKEQALEMCKWLATQNCEFVEQPMPKEDIESLRWLTSKSPLPIIADEAIQNSEDVVRAHGIYSGVNIKLMKCGGLREAQKMITLARAFKMKVMLGCMIESSCAISAASQLSTQVDWADLDGNLLITNDPFQGHKVVNGKIHLNDQAGIGLL